MPQSKRLKAEKRLGLWDRSLLPSLPVYRVLVHLTEQFGDSHPHLYVIKKGKKIGVAVSNSDKTVGFVTRIPVQNVIYQGLIEKDSTAGKNCGKGVTAYRISSKGIEAIVQFRVKSKYDKISQRILISLLREERSKFR